MLSIPSESNKKIQLSIHFQFLSGCNDVEKKDEPHSGWCILSLICLDVTQIGMKKGKQNKRKICWVTYIHLLNTLNPLKAEILMFMFVTGVFALYTLYARPFSYYTLFQSVIVIVISHLSLNYIFLSTHTFSQNLLPKNKC